MELTHRQRQALWTRRLIVDAARKLFLERGYAATTIDAIAKEAGVAVSTVYAIYKNKRAILRAIREVWHEQTHAREINEQASRQPDPGRRLRMVAHATRRQWEAGGALVAIYQGAAAADREAAAELREALRGRRAALDRIVQGMEAALRQDLDSARAAAILRASAGRSSTGSWWRSRDGHPTNTRPGCSLRSRSNCCLVELSIPNPP